MEESLSYRLTDLLYQWYIKIGMHKWHGTEPADWLICFLIPHYNEVIMSAISSQITSITDVYSTVYSGTDERKHQSSALLAFLRGIHRSPVNSPYKRPVTRKMFPFDDVIMFTSLFKSLHDKCVYVPVHHRRLTLPTSPSVIHFLILVYHPDELLQTAIFMPGMLGGEIMHGTMWFGENLIYSSMLWKGLKRPWHLLHYYDVIMGTTASQITSLAIVYSIVYSGADQRKHQRSASLAFMRGIHRDRWIPRSNGQQRGKCFHLMTSSW